MRSSLFSRLTLGYLAIFLSVAAVGAYQILKLREIVERTESILSVDNRVLDYEKTLAVSLERLDRVERRYIITKDERLHEELVRLKEEFNIQLRNAMALGDAASAALLAHIEQAHRNYEELTAEEAGLIRAKKAYREDQFKQDKVKLVEEIQASLKRLTVERQQTTDRKVRELANAADQALKVSVMITAGCLVAIVLMSLLITRGIARPLALLKNKTREIAGGSFEGGLQIRSPREIGDLAQAFNLMCERLKELDRMKDDFYASMAHELRTPLTCIKEGTAQLLDGVGGETTERQRKLLAILAEESNRLIGVVNSLLDLAKMDAGMMSYDFETVSLDPLIRRAVAEITPLVEAKQIILQSAVDEPLPSARLDPERILQVLRNLIGNAVKFTPRGGQVKILARPVNGKLEVSVKDSGQGIPAESLTTIFEKFSQVNHRGANTKHGTGLGLAIARNIITSHGGEIWAESQLGQGSTFVFVLPC